MSTQIEIAQRSHRRAVRFCWALLVGATAVSLLGNVAHSMLPFISRTAIQIGAAGVPPVFLLAAVHGIALVVRAGASGRVYVWAVSAVGLIGSGAFTMSFLALRDLMQAVGYGTHTAWVFPAIIDTTVAVSTALLVALGDRPVRRVRSPGATYRAQPDPRVSAKSRLQSAKAQVGSVARCTVDSTTATDERSKTAAAIQPRPGLTADAVQSGTSPTDAELASELIGSGATTQSIDTVLAVLKAYREGLSINAAAKSSGINYRTAQRIVGAARSRQSVDYRVAS